MPYQLSTPSRATFTHTLTAREVAELAQNVGLRVLQTAEPAPLGTWELLNEEFIPLRPDVEIRVYGFYGQTCDLSFVKRIRNVRRFTADCLMEATGTEWLVELPHLESLHIGIYNLQDFGFLPDIPSGVSELGLFETRSKKPSIEAIGRFHGLNILYLEGHQKGIAAIAQLGALQRLTLRSITTPHLDYLVGLDKLWSLDIELGGITNLSALECNGNIKYLELCMVRGLSDLSVVSTLTGLQFLRLQALKHVKGLPDLSRLTRLRRIVLDTMRGLSDVGKLATAPALEEFLHIAASELQPADYIGLLRIPTLRRAFVGFPSDHKHCEFDRQRAQFGVAALGTSPGYNAEFTFVEVPSE